MSIPPSTNPTLCELTNCTFVVKAYQRGYKWTDAEITPLLNDINNTFASSYARLSYSLQPIVVRQDRASSSELLEGQWELIDGQQRMTTLYLILSVLGGANFTIRYKTREGSERYLATEGAANCPPAPEWKGFAASHPDYDNVDVYHFFHAQKAIWHWLDQKVPPDARKDFREKLLNQVSVIWYDPGEGTDAHRLFRDLNVGKIPLTDAELIKAELIRAAAGEGDLNGPESRMLGSEWDDMEQQLHDQQFWAFLHPLPNGQDYANRIELPLRLALDMNVEPAKPGQRDLYRQAMDPDGPQLRERWKAVRHVFRALQEWFADDEVFHWVGFLRRASMGDKKELGQMWTSWSGATRPEFHAELRRKVAQVLRGAGRLEDLSYAHRDPDGSVKRNNAEICRVLLFFNVQTLRSAEGHWRSRFRFDLHDAQKWSLEHIHARNEVPPKEFKRLAGWLRAEALRDGRGKDVAKYKDIDPNGGLKKWNDGEAGRSDTLDDLFRAAEGLKVDDALHDLKNLSLLDCAINASLNNGYFDEKRRKIIDLDRAGDYVPPATRNVFLKYYTPTPRSLDNWDVEDQTAYLEAITDAVKRFTPKVQP